MTSLTSAARPLFAVAALLVSATVLAHPKLVSTSPAADTESAPPQKIELQFSENLVKQFSGANLVMTGMPGMSDHPPMKIPATISGSDDPRTMVITPKTPLVPGSYRVDWRAVSSDTHPVTGTVNFKVK